MKTYELHFLFWLLLSTWSCHTTAQQDKVKNFRTAFYNVENLFDTIDDPEIPDDGFTPEGRLKWTDSRYQTKLQRIARVIEAMDYPELIGLAEIENERVLRDLLAQDRLAEKGYRFLHRNSPDERGIDLAILYRKGTVHPMEHSAIEVRLHPSIADDPYTRDILKARLRIGTDTMIIYVNHWPSRAGGLAATEGARMEAARILRSDIQSELQKRQNACMIVMGDFNDEPVNRSLAEVLRAGSREELIRYEVLLFNPSIPKFKEGIGSYNFRGKWNMLDQILLTQCFVDGTDCPRFLNFSVFRANWLMYRDNRFGIRPSRTYGGPNYYGGFSDHLPVYADFNLCLSGH